MCKKKKKEKSIPLKSVTSYACNNTAGTIVRGESDRRRLSLTRAANLSVASAIIYVWHTLTAVAWLLFQVQDDKFVVTKHSYLFLDFIRLFCCCCISGLGVASNEISRFCGGKMINLRFFSSIRHRRPLPVVRETLVGSFLNYERFTGKTRTCQEILGPIIDWHWISVVDLMRTKTCVNRM